MSGGHGGEKHGGGGHGGGGGGGGISLGEVPFEEGMKVFDEGVAKKFSANDTLDSLEKMIEAVIPGKGGKSGGGEKKADDHAAPAHH